MANWEKLKKASLSRERLNNEISSVLDTMLKAYSANITPRMLNAGLGSLDVLLKDLIEERNRAEMDMIKAIKGEID